MKSTIKKTTKTTTAITWDGTVTDDSGKPIARMTGSLSASSPLGNTNLMVLNSQKYAENADEVKTLYESFQAKVQEAVEGKDGLSGSVTETLEG